MNNGDGQPLATYRLQFNRDFRFADAQALVPYFSRLGITHVYASPILRARQESTHGYDVVDPATINPNLGDKTDLVSFVTTLHNYGLRLALDIVPNHMAASIENPYWRDVLTYGPSSPYASWFDIDWRMPNREMWGRVLVPVLGEPLRKVIQQDQILVEWSDGRFLVRYFEHAFPVDPAVIPSLFAFGIEALYDMLEEDHPALPPLRDIIKRLRKLPKITTRLRRRVEVDREETEQWLAQFAQLVVQSPRLQAWVETTAARFTEGEEGRRRLRKFLDAQPYRLVYWREAARAINYRRFFDINELVSICQENPQVFQDTHATLLRWIEDGLVDALRVDHIDGLRDPLGYLERLSEAVSTNHGHRSLPIFVEKILAADEKLPCGWPAAGTTGYEFLNQAEAVFVSWPGFAEIEDAYRRMLRRPVQFEETAARGKRRVLRNELSPHVGRLADILLRIAERSEQTAQFESSGDAVASTTVDHSSPNDTNVATAVFDRAETVAAMLPPAGPRDLSKRELVDALVETIVALPVYRTYVDSEHCTLSDADRQFVETALAGARNSGRAVPEAVDLLGEVLLLENRTALPEHEVFERVNFIQRFQQITGPAAAKGIEDTALYSYVPLVSLNEVGGEPRQPHGADALDVLHRANAERSAIWPQAMLCVTTHDTKRTADVRARLDVLSEIPKLWTGLVRRWQRTNRQHLTSVRGKRAPDAVAEYLFYQTIVGIWPFPDPRAPEKLPSDEVLNELRQRIEDYMLKAVREAKTNTSWTQGDQEYEDALRSFVADVFQHRETGNGHFLSDVQHLVARIGRAGFWNSLSRTLIQFAAPGTPDLYQGDELWNFALVDPDNRRPVDFERRSELLNEVVTATESPEVERRTYLAGLAENVEDGRIKLHVIHAALTARRDHPELFCDGEYVPLRAEGPLGGHVAAFARHAGSLATDSPTAGEALIAIFPRLTTTLVAESTQPPIGGAVWSDTSINLPEKLRDRAWTNLLTQEQVEPTPDGKIDVADALQLLPVALLASVRDRREQAD